MDCDICFEPYDTGPHAPKLVPCGHTVCLLCLRRADKQECPLCRSAFTDHCTLLPTNYTLLRILEERFGDDRTGKSFCSPPAHKVQQPIPRELLRPSASTRPELQQPIPLELLRPSASTRPELQQPSAPPQRELLEPPQIPLTWPPESLVSCQTTESTVIVLGTPADLSDEKEDDKVCCKCLVTVAAIIIIIIVIIVKYCS